MSASTQVLNAFRSLYSLRPPEITPKQPETVQLDAVSGLHLLEPAPACNILYGTPPSIRASKINTYLWVIDLTGIPYIFEAPIPAINSSLPKHTNLTGGGEAYLGGEIWFASTVALYMSGGSGRYPPISETQLEEATRVFESLGYQVSSLGWDCATGKAKRSLEVT